MVARTEEALRPFLNDAIATANAAERAASEMRKARVKFAHEARRRNWSWTQIGAALNISEVGAKRYYDRHFRAILPQEIDDAN